MSYVQFHAKQYNVSPPYTNEKSTPIKPISIRICFHVFSVPVNAQIHLQLTLSILRRNRHYTVIGSYIKCRKSKMSFSWEIKAYVIERQKWIIFLIN